MLGRFFLACPKTNVGLAIAAIVLSCGPDISRERLGQQMTWRVSLTSRAHAGTCENPPVDEPDNDGDEDCPPGFSPRLPPVQLWGFWQGLQNLGDNLQNPDMWRYAWDRFNNVPEPAPFPPKPPYLADSPPLRLGMYVSPGFSDQPGWGQGWGGVGGAYLLRSNGYAVTDAVFAATQTPSVRTSWGHGFIYGTYDASHLVPTGQSLKFTGLFDFASGRSSLGPLAGLGSTGSTQMDLYTFEGLAHYTIQNWYLEGSALGGIGRGSTFSAIDNGHGKFNARGFGVDGRLGYIFLLFGSVTPTRPSALPTKAPPLSRPNNGYVVGLDLSAHIGYLDAIMGGFTDSAGFATGNGEAKSAIVGPSAKLFALVSDNGWFWNPYIREKFDHLSGFSSTQFIPSQPLLPTGDVVTYHLSRDYWGTDLGLNVQGPNGWTAGVELNYLQSSDTIITGVNASIKIPFNYTPHIAARY